jgi:RNA-binding protein YhbY
MTQSHIQLGKSGITENFLDTLKDHFKKHDSVKISVLKSAGHEKSKAREYSDQILEVLGGHYTAKIIGFTIFIKKWRKKIR